MSVIDIIPVIPPGPSFDRSQEERTSIPANSDNVLQDLPVLPPGLFSSQSPPRQAPSDLATSRSELSMRIKHLAWSRCLSQIATGPRAESQPAVGTISGLGSDSRIRGPRPLSRESSRSSIRQSQSVSALAHSRGRVPTVTTTTAKASKKNEDLEESPKFRLRKDRIRELERLQELEDERDANKQESLHALQGLLASQTFSNVSANFEDLDGLGHMWEQCSVRRVMRDRWIQQCASSSDSTDDYLNILGGRNNYRSVHALYADLSADTERLPRRAPATFSRAVDIHPSVSMPLMTGCRSLSRASTGSTIRPRVLPLSRNRSGSRSLMRRTCSGSRTVSSMSKTRSGCAGEANHGATVERSGEAGGGIPMILEGLFMPSRSSMQRQHDSVGQPPHASKTMLALLEDHGKKRMHTLPRMTRTVSSATADSVDHSAMQNLTLSSHVKRLAEVEALREDDSDDEAGAPLMMRPRSSASTSGSSSFGVKPLRAKKLVIRPKARTIARGINAATKPDKEEEVDVSELKSLLQQEDPTLLWSDGPRFDEQERRPLPPPPGPKVASATWSGHRMPFTLGSTISRASGRGKHAGRRAPLPSMSALEGYLANPAPELLTPLSEALNG